jgi:predicted permease
MPQSLQRQETLRYPFGFSIGNRQSKIVNYHMRWYQRLFRRTRTEKRLDAELRFHLEQQVADYLATGIAPEEARRRARLEFGGLDQVKEECRDVGAARFVESVIQDIRFGLRQMRRNQGFTAVAVITLALGIAATTLSFTLLDGLVLRDLPVPHPEQIVRFGVHTPGDEYMSLSLPMFEEIARDQRVFSGVFAWMGDTPFNVNVDGLPSRASVWTVTGNFYSQLGATPQLGRLIGPADVDLSTSSPAQVVVLNYGFWQRSYGGARSVIGKTLKIEGVPFTIVGVTRKGFNAMSADSEAEITVPLTAEPLLMGWTDVQKHLRVRQLVWLDAAGRLRSGISIAQARARLDSLWPAIRRATSPVKQTPAQRVIFNSLQMKVESGATGGSFLRGLFAKPMYVLLGIAVAFLLLACVNVATLALSRAAARSHEFGVRAALGAGRARLTRQMLVESLSLSILGTFVGFALASWGADALAAFLVRHFGQVVPALLNVSPDRRILGFAAGAAVLTGLLFGLAPSWIATRHEPNSALQQGSRTVGRATGRIGRALIVTQVALSLGLLAGAGLFIRTLEKLNDVQPGFRIDHVLNVRLFPRPHGFKGVDQLSYFHEIIDRVSHLPGVVSASIEHGGIGAGYEWTQKVRVHGLTGAQYSSECDRVMPGFFRTVGISLLQGRTFNWRDNQHSPHIAVVSEDFAETVFPKGDAIGRRINIASEPRWHDLTIVGIVSDATLYDLRQPAQPTVYIPTLQYKQRADFDGLLVRTKVPPGTVSAPIRQIVSSLGHQYLYSVEPLAETVRRSILPQRMIALLSAFFGALALLLVGVGLFGLLAYNVTRRTGELGIRLALGARPKVLLGMIVREALELTAVGIIIGAPCAFAATHLISHMLFGVTPYDAMTFGVVSIALLVVSTVAGFIPARRAANVDPMVALRHE